MLLLMLADEKSSPEQIDMMWTMLAVSGSQIERPALNDWIERQGLQNEWWLVSG